MRHTEWLREQDAGEAPMGSSVLEEPICSGLGSYVTVRVLLVYEWLLHYFLPYLCHYSLDPGWWRMEGAGLQGLPQQLREIGPQEEKA